MPITDKQIKVLREESIAHGDYTQADVCDRALATATMDQDGNEIPLADWTREEARAECARVITYAERESA